MSIVYIHQYFVTPEEGGAVRSFHLARGLVNAGLDVEMITSHDKANYHYREIEGIKVHYLPVAYDNRFSFMKRLWAFFQFVRRCKRLLKKLSRPDLLYITSTPLTTGLIGLWAKRSIKVPFIFEVRDLWPEAPIQVGVIRNPLLKKTLYRLEEKLYNNALEVVGLSGGICAHVQEQVPGKKVSLIPNFSDVEFFNPSGKKDKSFLQHLGWKADRLTIAYTGALGDVNAVEELLELAAMARKRKKNWQFAIMGKGKRLPDLKEKARQLALENLKFLPFGNKEKVRELLGNADIAFISFDHLPVLQTNSPNKFFDALAMGNAVMVNHQGWICDLITRHRIGIYFDIHHPEEAICQLEEIEKDCQLLTSMKRCSRSVAELHFSKEKAIGQLLHVIDPAVYPKPVISKI